MNKDIKVEWEKNPEKHDYPAALSYLSLVYSPSEAKRFIKALKREKIVFFKRTCYDVI